LERTATVWLVSLTRMCDTVSWTTATAVTCNQPDYMAATWIDRLSTTVSGLVGTRTLLFTFDGARAFVLLCASIARRTWCSLARLQRRRCRRGCRMHRDVADHP
jgi:hypothetical protein